MATKRAWSLLVAFSVVFTVVAGLKMCPNGFVESSPHFVSLNGLKCFNMTGLGSYFWKSQYPLPLEDGVHYASGSGFRVWAPHASSVWVNATLKSSGNHVVPLKQEGYGTWFNNVGGVQAGDTYTFIINYQSKNYTRLDPFAYALDQVTDSVYTQSVVADLSFDWGNTTIPSFSLDQIVIYEMQIPTFNPSSSNGVGTFQQAISKLDYLKELGVTIIEPIPINTYSGDARGWGYNPTVPNTIMNAFGGLNGFRQFVMACHQRGMGVFVDVVWNHMGSPNILALYDGWSQAQPGFPTNSGPPQGIYFYQDENAVTEWGPRPNYGDPHVQTLIYDSITFLLKECRVSGFRWDSTICIRKGGTECWYEPDDLMDGYKMLQKANSIIDSFHGISIAEDLQGNQTVVTAVNKGGIGFTSQWDDNSYYQLHDVLGSQADSSRDINEYAQMLTQGDLTRTIYTENHDKASGQNAGQGRWPNIVDSSQPTSYIAQKLSTLGIATVFTAPGIPLIFYGQEFLDSQNFVFGDVPNLDWSKVGDFSGGKWNSIGPFNGIFNMTQDMIALRLNQVSGVDSSSLMTTTIFTYQLSQQNKVLAFTRGSNNNLVVLMNLSSVAYNSGYIIGAPAAGSWSIVFNSDLKKYSSAFGGVGTGVSSISSQPNSYGPFSNSINVPLGAYSCVILVRD